MSLSQSTADPRTEPMFLGSRHREHRCTATITIHEQLQRSLAGAGGHGVPALHRCVRRVRHSGAHRALADEQGAKHNWFRWDDGGFRLGIAVERRSPPPRHATPPSDSLPAVIEALAATLDRLADLAEAADPELFRQLLRHLDSVVTARSATR